MNRSWVLNHRKITGDKKEQEIVEKAYAPAEVPVGPTEAGAGKGGEA